MLVMEHQVESFQLPNSCPVFWALQGFCAAVGVFMGFCAFLRLRVFLGAAGPPPSAAPWVLWVLWVLPEQLVLLVLMSLGRGAV